MSTASTHGIVETIPASSIPKRKLASGDQIPVIGLGTFGSDHTSPEKIAETVIGAAEAGYRHFDCASIYGNEASIGRSLQQIMQAGVPRSELWINSKVWNDRHAYQDVIDSCRKSLDDLHLDYLDLYLVHWPFPNFHPPGCDVTARSLDSKPYIHASFMKTWSAMEKLVELGLVRNIGTSNMTIPKLRLLLRDAQIKPVCNEMELHPHFQQPELFRFVIENGIVPIGYCPLGSPSRPERDRTPGDTVDLEDPVIVGIARRLDMHPAAICIQWAVRRGEVVIPMSTNPRNYLANLKSAASQLLTSADMEAIASIDRNCRLIKGQVFLWKEGQTWEDLWDLNGEITPP